MWPNGYSPSRGGKCGYHPAPKYVETKQPETTDMEKMIKEVAATAYAAGMAMGRFMESIKK